MIVICDIDGTAANIDHRRKFVEGNLKDWRTFFREMIYDTPHAWCQELLQSLQEQGHDIYFVTGRPEDYRKETEIWLSIYYPKIQNKNPLMRSSGDLRPDYKVKEEIYQRHFSDRQDEILFIIDDRQQVVDMWREKGLTVLQCAKGDF